MKLYHKERLTDGTRNVYVCGMKMMSYKCKKQPPKAKVFVHGEQNDIVLADPTNPNLSIEVYGNNNTVRIETEAGFTAHLCIGTADCPVSDCTIVVGKKTTSSGPIFVRMLESNSRLTIGEDCMFATNVNIYVSDTHCILDKEGKLTNIGRFVEIGDHCWICFESKILKNTRIPTGCVVGMGAVVASQFSEANCVLAGNPARIVKREITWDRMRPQAWLNENTPSQG